MLHGVPRKQSGVNIEIVGALAGGMPPEGVLKLNEVFTATERIISPKVSLMIGMHAHQVKPRNMIIALEEVRSRTMLRESAIGFKRVSMEKGEMK